MTIKDSVAVLDPKNGAGKPGRRGEAVGAEVPVTVHASRTTQGMGKNLPSVHEETKTVIVLQQGAVVRLTATLTTGETVVLTNRVTGADVLCRVGNVKSQPGIQHYVDLEFIQRAPSFWGDTLSVYSPAAPEAPAATAAAPSPSVSQVATPAHVAPPPIAVMASPPPAPVAQPVAVAPPPPPIAFVAPPVIAAPPPLQSLQALAPFDDSESVVAAEQLQPAALADPISASWKTPQAGPVPVPRRSSTDTTFATIGAESMSSVSSGSQKGLMVAAAVVLVLCGAAGGYWYTQQGAAASTAPVQPAANVAPTQPTVDLIQASAPVVEPAPPSTAAPEHQADIVLESRQPAESAPARIQPPAVRAAAARRNNVQFGEMKAPKAKTVVTRVDSTEPLPMMVAANNLGDVTASNALLAGASSGPAAPVNARPSIGGQLQPPQVITSTAPVYPQAARMQNLQGVVVLDVLVDETGKVVETKVIAGPQPLLMAAQDSVRNWKYKPAQLNGKPIAVHTKVSVRFAMR